MLVALKFDREDTYFVIDRTLIAILHYPRPEADLSENDAILDAEAVTDELRTMGVWEELLLRMAEHASRNLVRCVTAWQTLHLRYTPDCGWNKVTYAEPESIVDADPRRGVILSFAAR